MQEVFILGSGNAFNIDKRGHTAFLLDKKFLIDCGATTLYKIQEFNIDLTSLKYVLITHFHGDHFAGLPFVLIYLKYILHRSEPIKIVGPIGLKENYQQLMNLTYPDMEFPFLVQLQELQKQEEIFLENYQIKAYPITHKTESIGYRIEDAQHSFAFTGDTILNEEVFTLMEGVDVGIVELSLWDNPDNKVMHVSLEELIRLRGKIHAKRLYFNHITDSLTKEVLKLSKNYPGFGIPLSDGTKIYF